MAADSMSFDIPGMGFPGGDPGSSAGSSGSGWGSAATAGGGILSGIAAIRQGYSTKAFDDLQATILGYNAGNLREQAGLLDTQAQTAELGVDVALAKGRYEEGKVRYAGRQTLATQRHWYASANLDPAYGSPLLHEALTAAQIESDVGMVRASSEMEAADAETRVANIYGQKVGVLGQAGSDDINAMVARIKGSDAVIGGYFSAGASFLSSMGKAASAGGGGGGGG